MSHYLILTSLFYPENAANAVRMRGLVEDLLDSGHQATVITGMPYYREGEGAEKYRGQWFAFERFGRARVIRCFVPRTFGLPLGLRLLTFFSFMILAVVGAIRFCRGRFDAILCISPPFFTGFSAYFLAKWFRCPWFMDIQDLYPETALQLGMIQKGPSYFLLCWLEQLLYHSAEGLIVISPGFRSFIANLGVTQKKILVIPSWIDEKTLGIGGTDKFTATGKTVILFCGNIGLAQNLQAIRMGFLAFREREDLLFLFVGDGVARKGLEQFFRENGMKNIQFTGMVPHERVGFYLRGADIALVHLDRNPLYKITIPSKTYEYLGMGLPILLGVEGEALALIQRFKAGIGFTPGDSDDFREKINQLLENGSARREMGYNGTTALGFFSRKALTHRYIQRMERSLSARPIP